MKILASGYNQSFFDSIYECELSDCGKLISIETTNGLEKPTFLAMSKDGTMLYAVTENSENVGFSALSRDSGGHRIMGNVTFSGKALCHLSLNESANMVAGTCYGSGDVYFYELDEKRVPSNLVMHYNYSNNGYVSHPHCIIPSKNEKYMYMVDLGRDRVVTYEVSKGSVREHCILDLQPGDGPRHIMHHPTLPLMYLITEYSNVMYVFSSDESTGELKVLQRLSTLKESFTDTSYGSSLCYSPKHKLLYGSNRGANSIAVFTVADDGSIEYLTESDCGGDWPRHIALNEDESIIYVANQRSDMLNIIPLSDKGIPMETVTTIKVKQASFVMPV